jgi:hypothetical protein
MSQGGLFKLVSTDEKVDKFFIASNFLHKRLSEIKLTKSPSFSDIEKSHILYIGTTYKPFVSIASEYIKIKSSGDATVNISKSGGTLNFTCPNYGHFTSDMVIYLKIKAIGNQNIYSPTIDNPYLRYCAYPGVRLLKKVTFHSDQVIIDEYNRDDVIANSKFFMNEEQKRGWEKCIGQQEKKEANYYANGFVANLYYKDGYQTPKLFHDTFELFIPLEFWHCKDTSLALLNDLIPNSQRNITCELAPLEEIVQSLMPDSNGLLKNTILPFQNLVIEDSSLYVNNLFVNPEILDIFTSKIGFELIRTHKNQTKSISSLSDSYLLDRLKYPVEYLMIGIRDRKLNSDFDRWHLMGSVKERINTSKLFTPVILWDEKNNNCRLECMEAFEVSSLEPIIDSIGITAHGIDIFPQISSLFYNSYMPIRYSSNKTSSSIDNNMFMINFCLYPGKFNPSGYYNLSSENEMYINYRFKKNISEDKAFELVISVSILNFIIRRDNKLLLKFSY